MTTGSNQGSQEKGRTPYAKADARRLLILLAAIDSLERPTLTTLSTFTGHNKGTIPRDVERLREQFQVVIEKNGPVYRIVDWGPILKRSGVLMLLESPRQPASD